MFFVEVLFDLFLVVPFNFIFHKKNQGGNYYSVNFGRRGEKKNWSVGEKITIMSCLARHTKARITTTTIGKFLW